MRANTLFHCLDRKTLPTMPIFGHTHHFSSSRDYIDKALDGISSVSVLTWSLVYTTLDVDCSFTHGDKSSLYLLHKMWQG